MEMPDSNFRGGMKQPLGFIANPMEGVNDGNDRRALRDIKNLIAAPPYLTAFCKRGLQDKNVADDENARPLAAGRPVTRTVSATAKSQFCAEEETHGTEIHKQPISIPSNALDSPTVIDVDDYKMWPMAEENTEIEMEDTADEHILDIDSNDFNDPLAVVDYVGDLYSFYRKLEASSFISPHYMLNQFDINEKMRAILVDWLIDIGYTTNSS